jgi:LCP family protein required for cell wall assembly
VWWISAGGLLLALCLGLYFGLYQPFARKALNTPLPKVVLTPAPLPATLATPDLAEDATPLPAPLSIPQLQETRVTLQADNPRTPVCGNQDELLILLVGIDYLGQGYLYGLADVIRLVRVDFTRPAVEVATLPRSLLVQVPPGLNAPTPILLNQAYFFGSPGMQRYAGEADGAGALAETIQYNFGLAPDHYLVVDFTAFIDFVDAVGGVEIELPAPIDDSPRAYFPAGRQTLTGEQALNLARIRRKYSESVRIDHQTLLLRALLRKLQQPATLAKLPGLSERFLGVVLTDLNPHQIQDGLCMLRRLDSSQVDFHSPGAELIQLGWAYVPSVSQPMNIYRWDAAFVYWLYDKLWFEDQP